MKYSFLLAGLCFLPGLTGFSQDQSAEIPPEATEFYEPVPEKISASAVTTPAPSDAIILFDGSDLSAWENEKDGGQAHWPVEDDVLTVDPGNGGIKTKEKFGDMQLHLEWRSPEEIEGEGQGRGNSGVYIMNKYEVQILDSYENDTYTTGCQYLQAVTATCKCYGTTRRMEFL